jgi:hypothetical protein
VGWIIQNQLNILYVGFCFVQINIIHRGPFSESRLNFRALNGPKYKASGLERILNKYFPGEPHLSTALTSVVIPAFDTKLQQPVFFSSWRVGVCCNAIFEFLPGLGPSSPCCLFFSPFKVHILLRVSSLIITLFAFDHQHLISMSHHDHIHTVRSNILGRRLSTFSEDHLLYMIQKSACTHLFCEIFCLCIF